MAATVRDSDPGHIRALTGLRAMAALWVVFYHLREKRPGQFLDWGPLDPVIANGHLGVDLFFVLSGYILAHVYRETFTNSFGIEEWASFLRNRLARIYPVHLATLAIMLGVYAVGFYALGVVPNNSGHYSAESLAHNLLLTHAWFPGVGAPNTPAWSISAEWFGYLLFPLLCAVTLRTTLGVQLAIAGLSMLAAQWLWGLHELTRFTAAFLFGIALCGIAKRLEAPGAIARVTRRWAASATVLGIGLAVTLWGDAPAGLLTGLFGLLIVALSAPEDIFARLLSGPVAVYLGEISYSIYMVHWPVWSVARHGLPRLGLDPGAVWVQSAVVAVILIAAALLYHIVEVPGRRLLRSGRFSVSWRRTDRAAPGSGS